MIPDRAVERFSLDDLLVDKNRQYSIKTDWTESASRTLPVGEFDRIAL
jgi:hypothetical protein